MARAAFVRGAKVPLHLQSRFTFHATIAESADDSGTQLRLAPRLYLLSHGLEVPLHPVNTDRDGVHQRKALRVFGQERLEITTESHVRATKTL
jgi:hypothetical protein